MNKIAYSTLALLLNGAEALKAKQNGFMGMFTDFSVSNEESQSARGWGLDFAKKQSGTSDLVDLTEDLVEPQNLGQTATEDKDNFFQSLVQGHCDCPVCTLYSMGMCKSLNSNVPVKGIKFKNNSKNPVEMFWLDWSGKETSYGVVQPGRAMNMNTYVTHPWRCKVKGKEYDFDCIL